MYSYRNLLVFNSVYTRLNYSFLNKFWKNAQKWMDNFMKWMGKPGKDFIKKINSRKSRKFRVERLEKDFISLEKFYPKKKLKFWKVRRHGRLTKKIFFSKNSLKDFLNISETQTFLPFIEKGEKGSLSCKFHHAVMKKKPWSQTKQLTCNS